VGTLAAAVLLGVVQGLTEFLPVSSSAHLILARAFFGWDGEGAFGLPFDVACHVGTLAAVLVYFRADLFAMARAVPRAFSPGAGLDARRIRLIAIGTIPVIVVGVLWARVIEASMRTPLVAAITLALGAVVFLLSERVGHQRKGDLQISSADAFIIGVAQSAALVPGVSRSGATISTSLLLGISRPAAARFSFLLCIPAILAAAGKEGLELRHLAITANDAVLFVIGAVTSAVVGYVTITFFLRYLAHHRLDVFAWYRLALAAVAFLWLATR
jgi:undecaprenyl-diphosphatase